VCGIFCKKLISKQIAYFLYTSDYYILQEKKTTYKNYTAGSMHCHNNPEAYTYKELFTLYLTPQSGGAEFAFHRFRHCQTHIGGHASGLKTSGGEIIRQQYKICVKVKSE